MNVEKSSRAQIAFRQSGSAIFATVLVLSFLASVAVPEARFLSGCLLGAYFVRTVVTLVNSDSRRDSFWDTARQIGFVLVVLVAAAFSVVVIVAAITVGVQILWGS